MRNAAVSKELERIAAERSALDRARPADRSMSILEVDKQKRLREAQRAWIKSRDAEADRIAREGGAVAPIGLGLVKIRSFPRCSIRSMTGSPPAVTIIRYIVICSEDG